MIEVLGAIVAIGFIFAIYVYMPAAMATERNRCAPCWILLGLVITPLLVAVLLLFLGDKK